jgi:predicted metal-binding membrane protein
MIVLFAVGVMSLAWMLVVTAVVLAEKAAPRGDRLVPATAVALAAAGVWAIL